MKFSFFVGTYSQKEDHVDGKGEGIYTYAFDEDTKRLSLEGLCADSGVNPTFLNYVKATNTLYVVNEYDQFGSSHFGRVAAYRPQNRGQLELLNEKACLGSYPCHVSNNGDVPDTLALANYVSGSVSMVDVESDTGLLGCV